MKKWLLRFLLLGFVLLNISSAFHAYKFTHFSDEDQTKSDADELSLSEKISVLFLGISNPRPKTQSKARSEYEVLSIPSGEEVLEGWFTEVDSTKGNVILFHGYSGEKSAMLSRASLIRKMGFNTLLIDFRGSGGSTGNTTTVGYKESEDVISAVNFLKQRNKKPIYLLGTPMGAAAVLKACSEKEMGIKGIILECPFESLLQTAENRFERMGLPSFPLAHMLVFWGGIENGFWGFSHSPAAYSKAVNIPTLLIFGEKDARVKRFEIDRIYENLAGKKEVLLFPQAAHGNYLDTDAEKWIKHVQAFLARVAAEG